MAECMEGKREREGERGVEVVREAAEEAQEEDESGER